MSLAISDWSGNKQLTIISLVARIGAVATTGALTLFKGIK